MKMMLTVKANPKVMMLHQFGINESWCQQKISGIEECYWHLGRILPGWCSIFPRLPSHHHEKASIWYSKGMPGADKQLRALTTLHGFYECSMLSSKNAIMPTIVFTLPGCQKFETATRFFTNLLYPNRMPLGFFTGSFPGESMTLSPVTLAQ